MEQSILNGKRILAVDDEPDVLTLIEDEIRDACPDSTIDKATTYDQAAKLLWAYKYDLVILDIMGVNGFDLLQTAVGLDNKVAMLTAHALSPDVLKKCYDMGARAYLPKDKLGELVPFLEDVLHYDHKEGWERLHAKMESYFNDRFDPNWKDKR
jgi:DNA-binding response OmpR family regulator